MAAIRGYRVKVATVTHYVQASECSDSAAHFCHTIKELQPERTYNIEVRLSVGNYVLGIRRWNIIVMLRGGK